MPATPTQMLLLNGQSCFNQHMMLTRYTTQAEFFEALRPYLQTQPDLNPRFLIPLPPSEKHHFLSLSTDAPTPFFVMIENNQRWVIAGGTSQAVPALLPVLSEFSLPIELVATEDLTSALLEAFSLHNQIAFSLPQNWYRLAQLRTGSTVPGQCRPAEEKDRALFLERQCAFIEEALGFPGKPDKEDAYFTIAQPKGAILLWDNQGEITAHLCLMPNGPRYTRIGSVYTPPELRGQGYARALTAAACQIIQQKGRQPCLFADARIEHTNRLYQSLGFVNYGYFMHYSFDAKTNTSNVAPS